MKKSDFAQKLLDDLRLRKQRLAAANASTSSDAHGSTFQRTHQGSRVPNIQETNGRQSRNHARHKSLAIPDSKEIVPIHRAQSSEYISDLSMALSFALENGGRLGKIHFSSNAMPGKKVLPRHLGTQSIDFSNMNIRYFSDRNRPSNGRFPHLSELHIQEIAKGAQKLNQILKACSNSVNLDAYLIDVGKELLKGAIDLEESLRMLVDLQEASEHTVARQSKRFQLLDGEESEDGEPIADNKLMALDRPRFSFDGSSRNHLKEVAKTSMLKKKLQVLSYPETMNSKQQNSQKQTTMISNLVPHRRSAGCDLDSKSTGTFSGTKKDFRSDKLLSPLNSAKAKVSSNSSSPDAKSKSRIKQPKSLSSEKDKGRIPNVIAKLMGLEELPLEIDTHSNGVKKAPESKQESHEISKKKALRSVKEVDSMIASSEKPVSRINQQMKVLEANKIIVPSDAAPETMVTEGKQKRIDLKYLENMNPFLKNSQKPILEINKKVNLINMDQMKENKSTKQEEQGRAENANHKEERNTGKGEQTLSSITQKPVLEFDSQRKISYTHDNSEAEVGEAAKGSPLLNEQKQKIVKEKIPMQSTKQKPIHENESKQQSSIQKPEPKEARHEAAEREQNTKTKLRIKDARSDMMPKSSLKHIHQNNVEKRPLQRKSNTSVSSKKNSSVTANTVHPKGHGNSTTSESNIQELANGRLEQQRPTYSKAAGEKVAPRNPPIVLLKPPRNLSTKKAENKQVLQTSEKARTTEEERDLKVGSLQTMTRPLKQQTSKELKQMSNERTSEAKEPIENIPPEISNQHRQQKAALPSPSLELPEDGVDSEKREKILTENTKNNVIPSKTFTALQLPEISSSEDEELKFNSKELPSKGMTDENMIDNCSSIEQRQQSVSKSEEIQEGSLNVHENQLKQILIKSQHFLNAAEAFFNLYIPADILHASYHTQPDKENKLVIDCAYEVMKRKGRREELVSLPPMKISIVSVKVKSFDDLVKELNEDLGHLRVHGKTKGGDHDAAQCLDKILKRDMQSWNPDANCMWDFGWIDLKCAYLETEEVIKDVEKFVLNRLIDEITKDLLSTSIASFTIPVF